MLYGLVNTHNSISSNVLVAFQKLPPPPPPPPVTNCRIERKK